MNYFYLNDCYVLLSLSNVQVVLQDIFFATDLESLLGFLSQTYE